METLFWIRQGNESGKHEYSPNIAGYGRSNTTTPIPAIKVAKVRHEVVDARWGPDSINPLQKIQTYEPFRPNHSYQSSKITRSKGFEIIAGCDHAERSALKFL